ncbi:MAG: hypothetical protein IJ650_05570 [Paludibacteraceae bacterium]|nr:hypothetical protein [Paludibacteraceae bacterium]
MNLDNETLKIILCALGVILVFLLLPEYPFFTRDISKAGRWNCLLSGLIRKLRK